MTNSQYPSTSTLISWTQWFYQHIWINIYYNILGDNKLLTLLEKGKPSIKPTVNETLVE